MGGGAPARDLIEETSMAQPLAFLRLTKRDSAAPRRAPAQPAEGAMPLPRIAFLFNAQSHHILHGATTAQALAQGWRAQVDILSPSSAHLDFARALADGEELHFRQVGVPMLNRLATRQASAVPPKLLTLLAASRQLDRYDAIALPERTSTIIRALGVRRPRLIHIDHGAGDRAAGFDPRIARFDFALLAGRKQERRMLDAGLIRPGAYRIIGYPKFDAADRLRDAAWYPFAERRPTILYNPHFSEKLGSWDRDGPAIVGRIAATGRHNLIVAPHIRLCDRPSTRAAVERQLAPYAGLPQVHVDLGSRRLVDMSYTGMADIYVGDVSSQIYEFLRRSRPALFVNSHGVEWRNDPNYAHWHLGPVARSVDELMQRLERVDSDHAAYADAQRQAFADTFDLGAGDSSGRAAAAIADFLKLARR